MGLFGGIKRGAEEAARNISKDVLEKAAGSGAAPTKFCPNCGTELPASGVAFCLNCGADLRGQAAAESKPEKEGFLGKVQSRQAEWLDSEIAKKRAQLVILDDALLIQEYGLYEPRFDFANSTMYKDKLKEVRERQKQMIRDKVACTAATKFEVNNSKAKGRKMMADVQKLLLRSFNLETDETVRKVKGSNFEASRDRIIKSAASVSRLGKTWSIGISPDYVSLKIDELHLAYEFALAKEREKEELRELREREREEAKLRKEIEAARKKLAKEQAQYSKELANVKAQLESCDEDQRAALEQKKEALENNLAEVDKGIEDVDYREANQRAGYVYIISNIGSFGPDVYKIGMTRRLEPMERIYELGDASVPFKFDVHALIFSKDAPGLEAALHRRFAANKVNLVNQRREFFRCSLDEIIEAVKQNYDETVEFQEVPDAEQYRTSEKMREAMTDSEEISE